MKHIKVYGSIDVSYYKKILTDSHTDWNNSYTRIRQQRAKTHQLVSVIPLMWSVDNLNAPPETQAPKTEFYNRYYHNVFFQNLAQILSPKIHPGYYIRILFANMPPHSIIPSHVDYAASLLFNHRIHIPIQTNHEVIFNNGEDSINMLEGNVYEIDNNINHDVINPSNMHRIHLIVDWHTT
jgi:hypothetical protein